MIIFEDKPLEFQLFITKQDEIIRRKWCLENDIFCTVGGCFDCDCKDTIMAIDIDCLYYTYWNKVYTVIFEFLSIDDMIAFKLRWI